MVGWLVGSFHVKRKKGRKEGRKVAPTGSGRRVWHSWHHSYVISSLVADEEGATTTTMRVPHYDRGEKNRHLVTNEPVEFVE